MVTTNARYSRCSSRQPLYMSAAWRTIITIRYDSHPLELYPKAGTPNPQRQAFLLNLPAPSAAWPSAAWPPASRFPQGSPGPHKRSPGPPQLAWASTSARLPGARRPPNARLGLQRSLGLNSARLPPSARRCQISAAWLGVDPPLPASLPGAASFAATRQQSLASAAWPPRCLGLNKRAWASTSARRDLPFRMPAGRRSASWRFRGSGFAQPDKSLAKRSPGL